MNEHKHKHKLRKEIIKNFIFEDYIYVNCKNNKFFKYKKFYMISKYGFSGLKKYYLINDMISMIRVLIYMVISDEILDKTDGEVMRLNKKGMFVYINKLYGKKNPIFVTS